MEREQTGFLYPLDLLRFLICLSDTGPHGCYLSGMNSGMPGLKPDTGGHAARDGAGAIGVKKLRLVEGAPGGAAVVAPGGNAQRGQPLAGEGGQMGQPFAAGAGGKAGGGFRAGGGEGSAHFGADFKGVRADAGA